MNPNIGNEPINSIIGEGAEFRGEFKCNGVLRIDGFFSGEIISNGTIIVGKSGVVKTDLKASNIVIGGIVEGDVYATKQVTLLATSKLSGNIVTPSLVVEEGVIFEGNCIINKNMDDQFLEKNYSFRRQKKRTH